MTDRHKIGYGVCVVAAFVAAMLIDMRGAELTVTAPDAEQVTETKALTTWGDFTILIEPAKKRIHVTYWLGSVDAAGVFSPRFRNTLEITNPPPTVDADGLTVQGTQWYDVVMAQIRIGDAPASEGFGELLRYLKGAMDAVQPAAGGGGGTTAYGGAE